MKHLPRYTCQLYDVLGKDILNLIIDTMLRIKNPSHLISYQNPIYERLINQNTVIVG